MPVVKLIDSIFSITPQLTALLLVVFIYALQRYEGVRGTGVVGRYKRLITFVFASIVLSVLCTFSSFLMLLDGNLSVIKEMFYLTVGLFWSILIVLVVACIIIVKNLWGESK